MDQQAKKHLQDEFDAALEEKDQMISVLQTQVSNLWKTSRLEYIFLVGIKLQNAKNISDRFLFKTFILLNNSLYGNNSINMLKKLFSG